MNRNLSALNPEKTGLVAWGWRLLMALSAAVLFVVYGDILDSYEVGIVILTAVGMAWLGQFWPGFRWHALIVAVLSLFAVFLYGTELERANTYFLLNYLLASQSAFMWMSALFVMATASYFAGLVFRSEFTEKVASFLTWSAMTMGMVGLMVRWRESYLMGADIGHIPVSNLYEVFILFAVVTALLYLFYERRYQTRSLGGFVLLVISAAVIFQLWYTFERQAHEIQPLVPALQSYWMKIHVPANFIGYGAFAMASMIGIAYLLVERLSGQTSSGHWVQRMPSLALMDDLMYKAIALGFAFSPWQPF